MEDVLGTFAENQREASEFLARFDAPAYVRRACAVEDALEAVLHRCRVQREAWLLMLRTLAGTLKGLAGAWMALRPWLADDEQVGSLESLHALLDLRPRLPVQRTTSRRVLRRALIELAGSVERFNRRWRAYLAAVDLSAANELRTGYNKYYLLEKECALLPARVARAGYRPLEPPTVADLLERLPLLPVPQLL